jgi:hypothetical protein
MIAGRDRRTRLRSVLEQSLRSGPLEARRAASSGALVTSGEYAAKRRPRQLPDHWEHAIAALDSRKLSCSPSRSLHPENRRQPRQPRQPSRHRDNPGTSRLRRLAAGPFASPSCLPTAAPTCSTSARNTLHVPSRATRNSPTRQSGHKLVGGPALAGYRLRLGAGRVGTQFCAITRSAASALSRNGRAALATSSLSKTHTSSL